VPNTDARTLDELRRETAELYASRARLITAADDRRRTIERELHDGAMQHLVALGVNLQLASRLVDGNSCGLPELLDEMLRNVHEALDDVRQLAWRIYPSLLVDGNVGDALRTAASAAGVPTRVDTTALGRCSLETAASIYFCCAELLNDAAGGSRHATVNVRSDGETVLFDVTLEGADYEAWAARDVSNVRDRIGAFGGQLTISPAHQHAVRISGALPMQPDAQTLLA
jgi:signal transduction histidine kinase